MNGKGLPSVPTRRISFRSFHRRLLVLVEDYASFYPLQKNDRGLRDPGPSGPPSLKICHWQIFRALRAP